VIIEKTFKNRVAIVTGAGRGLGREFAIDLAAKGVKVVINGRGSNNAKAEQAVVDEIISAGGEAVVEIASVTDDRAVNAMIDRVISQWGRIDILINNAGILNDGQFTKKTVQNFEQVIDVHLMGAARCCHAVWPHMLKQNYGRIIMLTSVSALAGNMGQSAYSAAKMGVIGLMNSLAIEGAGKNVFVNALAPLGITRMNENFFSEEIKTIFTAKKLASVVAYLASEAAPNGALLMSGGGVCQRVYNCVTAAVEIDDNFVNIDQLFEEISSDTSLHKLASVQDQLELALECIT
jgi:NAD(P)-dependent dehydrogenase (short-subunit alcohol dehydrogenase family)